MIEPIQEVLEISGVPMDFSNYEIYGLPGFEISALYKGELTLYEVRQQHFTFHISSEDLLSYNPSTGDTFFITDESFVFEFAVQRPPEPDLTGMAVLFADYIGKSNV